MMLRVGYPEADDELRMLRARRKVSAVDARVTPSDVTRIRDFIRETVFVEDRLMAYIVRLGRATRHPGEAGRPDLAALLTLGVSPRSYQHILALSRVNAFLHGRSYVLPADVKEIYCDAVRHRIARSLRAQADNVDSDTILNELLAAVPA
jgi:MoxR-like ATPase